MGVKTVCAARAAEAISAAIIRYVSPALVMSCLAGCAGGEGVSEMKDESLSLSPRVVELGDPVPKGGGVVKVGLPYNVAGQIYVPREDPAYDKVGVASWYGVLFHGRRTSNGEIYDMNALTAAHPTLPLPSYARVTNLENNRSIIVRINDRGPYKKDRIIDLSDRAAELLGFKAKGTARVRVQYAGPAPLNGDDTYERQVLAKQPWAAHIESVAVADSGARRGAGPKPAFQTASLMPPLTPAPTPPARQLGAWAPQREPTAAGQAGKGDLAMPNRGGVFVQAGLFSDPRNAEALRRRMALIGPTQISQVNFGGDVLHRVSIGPFVNETQARWALDQAGAAGIRDAKLVSE